MGLLPVPAVLNVFWKLVTLVAAGFVAEVVLTFFFLVVILGATGPVDAMKRRPWIDWIHTAADQGALVRGYTKWDDQPASPGAAVEAIRRAFQISMARPCGPVYVNLDAAVQEMAVESAPKLEPVKRFAAPADLEPPRAMVEAAVKALAGARNPLILSGRCTRSEEGWKKRVELAEWVGARVVTPAPAQFSGPVEMYDARPVVTSIRTNWLVATNPKTLLRQYPMPQISA